MSKKLQKKYEEIKKLIEEGKSDVDIAHTLKMTLPQVEKFRKEMALEPDAELNLKQEIKSAGRKKAEAQIQKHQDLLHDFKQTKRYESLMNRLSVEHLDYFTEKWLAYMEQFENPTATEQDNIELLILTKLRLEANDVEFTQLQRQQSMIDKALEAYGDEPDMEDDDVRALFQQSETITSLKSVVLKQNNELTDKYQAHLRALNATREQREKLKGVSGETFTSLVKMFSDELIRLRIGRQSALVQMAAQNKEEKWKKDHTFMNGDVNPIIMDGADNE